MFRRSRGDKKPSETVSAGQPKSPSAGVTRKDAVGLEILHDANNNDATIDIVALHGLGGGSRTTWTHKNGTNWLDDLLQLELPQARIMTYGYDSSVTTKARTERSNTFAEGLLSRLRAVRSGQAQNRPLIFIAHSLGGIVVKRALIIAKLRAGRYGQILDCTRHVMFFGTPHQGTTAVAGFIRRLGAALSSESSVLRELELWSPEVLDVNSAFLTEIAPSKSFTSFFEREPLHGVQVVDEGSARLNQANEDVIGLDANHLSMCKFADAQSAIYIDVVLLLRAVLADLTAEQATEAAREMEQKTKLDDEDQLKLGTDDERLKDLLERWDLKDRFSALSASDDRSHLSRSIDQKFDDALEHELPQWIAAPPSQNDYLKHRSKISRHCKESGSWILRHEAFQSWSSAAPVLWIAGRAGCGKSILAATVVHHFRHDSEATRHDSKVNERPRTFVAYAFSDKQDEAKRSSSALLRMIVWQIMTSGCLNPTQKLEILHEYRRTGSSTAQGACTGHGMGFEYLTTLFKTVCAMIKGLVLVFDGIDECDDAEKLLDVLANLTEASPSARILIVSQKIQIITEQLKDVALRIDMDDPSSRSSTERDIEQYMRAELLHSPSARVREHADAVARLLKFKANGLFLWAAAALPEVEMKAEMRYKSKQDFFRSVQDLPEKLEDTLCELLDRILQSDPSVGTRLNAQRKESLLRILQWVFYASRPLSCEELQAALAIPDYDEETLNNDAEAMSEMIPDIHGLLASCYPVLYVSSKTVHIMHSEFAQFITPQDGSAPSAAVQSRLGQGLSQSHFASRCLTYLSRSCFKNFWHWHWGLPTYDSETLLEYAVLNWPKHAMSDPVFHPRLQEQLAHFLCRPQALFWLEQWYGYGRYGSGHDLVGRGFVADPSWLLQLLQACVEERQERTPDLLWTWQLANSLGHQFQQLRRVREAEIVFKSLQETEKARANPSENRLLQTTYALAMVYREASRFQESEQLYEETLQALKTTTHPTLSISEVEYSLAALRSRMGQFAEAQSLYARYLQNCLDLYGKEHASTASAYQGVAFSELGMARYSRAQHFADEALLIYDKIGSLDHSGRLSALQTLASALSGLGASSRALKLTHEVCEQRMSLLGHDHPLTMTTTNNLSTILGSLEQYDEAIAHLKPLVDRMNNLYGPDDPSTLSAKSNLATFLEATGGYQEGLQIQRSVLESRMKSLGNLHTNTILSMNNLALSEMTILALDECQSRLCGAIKALRPSGPRHAMVSSLIQSLASLCSIRGWHDLALYLAGRSLEGAKELYDEESPKYLAILSFHGSKQQELGNFEQSVSILKSVLRRCPKDDENFSNIVETAKLELSVSFRQLGYYSEAEHAARDVVDIYAMRAEPLGVRLRSVMACQQLALALLRQGRLKEALGVMQPAVDATKRYFGVRSLPNSLRQCVLALIYLETGNADESEQLIQPIVAYWSETLGREHSLTGMALDIAARSLQKRGRFDEAEPLQVQALIARLASMGPRHMFTLSTKHHYALLLWDMGERAEAHRLLAETNAETRDVVRPGHPLLSEMAEDLSRFSRQHKLEATIRVSEAFKEASATDSTEHHLTQALHEACKLFGPDDPEILLLRRDIALQHKEVGRTDEARHELEAVLEQQIKTQGAHHTSTLHMLVDTLQLAKKSDCHGVQFDGSVNVAIRQGDVLLLKRLLEQGASYDEKDRETGLSSLALAVSLENESIVRCLVEDFGMNPNSLESDVNSVLHSACMKNLPGIVRVLLKHRAETSVLTVDEGRSALHLACARGYDDVVRLLLDAGADTNLVEDKPALVVAAEWNRGVIVDMLLDQGAALEQVTSDGLSALAMAVHGGHLGMVKQLVSRGSNLSWRAPSGVALIHLAAFKGSFSVVEFLLQHGADPHAVSTAGARPLNLATEAGHVQVMDVLMENGADITLPLPDDGAFTPLITAARFGSLRGLERVLKEPGQTPNTKAGFMNAGPLVYAVTFRHTEVAARLIELGADVNEAFAQNLTVLKQAVMNSDSEMVARLLAADADPNECRGGLAPLAFAMLEKDIATTKTLLQHPHTDVNIVILENLSPLLVAVWTDADVLVPLMLERGACTNFKGTLARLTALHFSIHCDKPKCASQLLAAGADPGLRDFYGRTPIDWTTTGDPTWSMLEEEFRTSQMMQLENNKVAVREIVRHLQELLADGTSCRDSALREQTELLITALFISGNRGEAIVAAECGFDWVDVENEAVNPVEDEKNASEAAEKSKEETGAQNLEHSSTYPHAATSKANGVEITSTGQNGLAKDSIETNALQQQIDAVELAYRQATTQTSRRLEHVSTCDPCGESMKGPAYWCPFCALVSFCSDCMARRRAGTAEYRRCPHEADSFLHFPRPQWYELDAKGFVDIDVATGKGLTLSQWLEKIEVKYRADEAENLGR